MAMTSVDLCRNCAIGQRTINLVDRVLLISQFRIKIDIQKKTYVSHLKMSSFSIQFVFRPQMNIFNRIWSLLFDFFLNVTFKKKGFFFLKPNGNSLIIDWFKRLSLKCLSSSFDTITCSINVYVELRIAVNNKYILLL